MRVAVGIVAAALAAACATPAPAMTVAQLMSPGMQLVQGDRVYSNFSMLSATLTPSVVTVTETADGLRFSAFWDTALAPAVDAAILYDVSTTGGSLGIQTVGLSMGGVSVANGGVASVGETIFDLTNPSNVYNISTYNDGSGGAADNNAASVDLAGAPTHIHVVKDVTATVNGSMTGSTASISFVDNSFATGGTGASIPEPMTVALLGLAGIGLGSRFRRRA